MDTEGTLEDFDVLAALVQLWRRRFTGALRFERESFIKIFYFHDGVIVAATSNDPPDQIGEILKKSGKVSDEQLHTVEESGGARSIAERLITAGFITRKELLWALKMQLIEMIGSILHWPDGSWSLVENYLPKRTENVSFLTQHVLLELILRSADRELILGRIISPDDVLVKSTERVEDYKALDLSKDADSIVSRLDGVTSTAEIAASSKIDDFSVFKLLGALKLLGVLEPAATEAESGAPSLEAALAAPVMELDMGTSGSLGTAPAGFEMGGPVSFEASPASSPAPEVEMEVAVPSFEMESVPAPPALSFEPEPAPAIGFEPTPAPVQMSIPVPEPEAEPEPDPPTMPVPTVSFEPEPPVRRAWEPPPISTVSAMPDLDSLNEPTLTSARTIGSLTPEADEESPSLESSLGETFEEAELGGHSTKRMPGSKAELGFLPKEPTKAALNRKLLMAAGSVVGVALLIGIWMVVSKRFFGGPEGNLPPIAVSRPRPVTSSGSPTTAREVPTVPAGSTATTAAPSTSGSAAVTTATAGSPVTVTAAARTSTLVPVSVKPAPAPTVAAPPVKPVPASTARPPVLPPAKTAAPAPVKSAAVAPVPKPAPAAKPIDYAAMARDFAAKSRSYPKGGWTIQIELVCADESLERALEVQTSAFRIWFIPISYRGKSCYRVFTGVYKTEAEARSAASNLPSHFTEGGNKPTAIPLTKALH